MVGKIKKERIQIEFTTDQTKRSCMIVSNVRGAGLTLADISNEFARMYGGGVYAIIINNTSGELTDKISSVKVYDVYDLWEKE